MLRARNSKGLNVLQSQDVDFIPDIKTEYINIISQNTPSWGAVTSIFYRNCKEQIHEIILDYSLPAFSYTGLTGASGANGTATIPAYFWNTKIELYISNVCVQTVYPNENFLNTNLYNCDEDRAEFNQMAGSYATATSRYNLNAAANHYYVNIWSLFNQSHPICMNADIEVRIYTDSWANIFTQGTATGTMTTTPTITQLSGWFKVTKLTPNLITNTMNQMAKNPAHSLFLNNVPQIATYTATSGSTSQIILNGLVGLCNNIIILVQTSTTYATQNGEFTYLPITSFSLQDSQNNPITGGSQLASSFISLVTNNNNTASSFTSEISGNVLSGNYSNYVYLYSFSNNNVASNMDGCGRGSRKLTGGDNLYITWASSGTYVVTIYGFMESCLEVSGVAPAKKFTL